MYTCFTSSSSNNKFFIVVHNYVMKSLSLPNKGNSTTNYLLSPSSLCLINSSQLQQVKVSKRILKGTKLWSHSVNVSRYDSDVLEDDELMKLVLTGKFLKHFSLTTNKTVAVRFCIKLEFGKGCEQRGKLEYLLKDFPE